MKKILYLALAALTLAFTGCNGNDPSFNQIFKDLNLPSGTKWTTTTESNPNKEGGIFTISEATAQFGDRIPSKEQWEELLQRCTFKKTADGLLLTVNSNSGNKMKSNKNQMPDEVVQFLIPFVGHVDCNDPELEDKFMAYLWSSSIDPLTKLNMYVAIQESGYTFHSAAETCAEMAVLLVNQSLAEGALSGVFSVGENKKVRFSKGNLQVEVITREQLLVQSRTHISWQFAENQWDVVGEEMNEQTINGDMEYDKPYYLDLFSWYSAKDPLNTSSDKYSTFTDWGDNPIYNGGNKAGMWRTLSKDEWVYLLHERANAGERLGFGLINDVQGYILLPDEWTMPESITEPFKPSTLWMEWKINSDEVYAYVSSSHTEENKYSVNEWSQMQANGAVFLPFAGRIDRSADLSNLVGWYWSSTKQGENELEDEAYMVDAMPYSLNPHRALSTRVGCSVRLVQNVE